MTAKQPAHMSKTDLQFFDKLLKDKRAELVQELGYIEQSSLFQNQKDQGGDLSGYTTHLADAASDYTSIETNFDLAEREGKYLVYIEEALERVRKETYGVCKVCEELIPRTRLEAVPTATKCVNCKEESKKREREDGKVEMARIFAEQQRRMTKN